jgi:PadR family transcriptional regulator, regulatory protein PadR
MRKQKEEPIDLLPGTLDLLILRTLLFGPIHGHAIAKSIERTSQDVLRVDHGSLYPALQRLERRGLIRHFGEQPPGQVLPPDCGRPQATDFRDQ